jgi:predicted transcriptional regulator
MIPTTLVDDAAIVWRLLGEGYTQAQVGEALGWSQDSVSDYAQLKKINNPPKG